eukprot:TRINITY_DN66769_c5_g1_i3.p2 TRINITY_DN66769_c5_g1~~TRINITY_DN66769_c5_g1_i3.p2  ORF type:complete len:287 (+),score=55.45 TRINITY_DN66769_c5_g1_i3:1086-1946(+)
MVELDESCSAVFREIAKPRKKHVAKARKALAELLNCTYMHRPTASDATVETLDITRYREIMDGIIKLIVGEEAKAMEVDAESGTDSPTAATVEKTNKEKEEEDEEEDDDSGNPPAAGDDDGADVDRVKVKTKAVDLKCALYRCVPNAFKCSYHHKSLLTAAEQSVMHRVVSVLIKELEDNLVLSAQNVLLDCINNVLTHVATLEQGVMIQELDTAVCTKLVTRCVAGSSAFNDRELRIKCLSVLGTLHKAQLVGCLAEQVISRLRELTQEQDISLSENAKKFIGDT